MNAYSIGYTGHESSSDVVLLHEKEFTRQEWEDMVVQAFVFTAHAQIAAWQEEYKEMRQEDLESAEKAKSDFGKAHYLVRADTWGRPSFSACSMLFTSSYGAWGNKIRPSVEQALCDLFGFELLRYVHCDWIWDMDHLDMKIKEDSDEEEGGLGKKISEGIRESGIVNDSEECYDGLFKQRRNTLLLEMGRTQEEIDAHYKAQREAKAAKRKEEESKWDTEDLDYSTPIDAELLKAFGAKPE